MNAIGHFGRFVTEYQKPIQIALIIILLAAAAYAIVRAVIHAREEKSILSQINETVTDISTAVNNLNDKKADVIYIDNRVPGQAPCGSEAGVQHNHIVKEEPYCGYGRSDAQEPPEKTEKAAEAADGVCSQIPVEEPESAEEIQEKSRAEEMNCDEEACPSKKYFSRDCAISKNGRTYTIEELCEQIKE